MSADTAQSTAGSTSAFPAGGPSAVPVSPVDRPEVQVGAAFAGGFLVALILKRLGN